MIDTELLKKTIEKSGISFKFIAEKIGISREGLYKKTRGDTEFKASEILALQKFLRLTDKETDMIFFAENSEYNSHII